MSRQRRRKCNYENKSTDESFALKILKLVELNAVLKKLVVDLKARKISNFKRKFCWRFNLFWKK